jgi:hypothetical protein
MTNKNLKINLDLSKSWENLVLIEKVEKKFNCKFVCETPLKESYGWRDYSSLIFYTEEPHPQGSNYLAISYVLGYDDKVDLVVSDGISATSEEITGIVDEDVVYYSRFRHDYRTTPSGMFIDGGRNYIRSGTANPDVFVMMKIVKDKLEII